MVKALALAIAALSLVAADSEPTDVKGWSIYKNEDNCALIQNWTGGFLLRVAHSEGDAYDDIMLTAPQFKSIEDGKKYPTELHFIKGNRVDSGWGTVQMRGAVMESLKAVSFRLKSDDFLNDLASSRLIVFERNEVLIASLDLDGSSDAIAALKKCSLQVEKANPSDPFKD